MKAGIEAISDRGGAAPGDRTMLDALHPAVRDMMASELFESKED
jgi:dihydroxyacetone kinase